MEINDVVVWCWCVLGERINGYCFVSQCCVVVIGCLMFVGGGLWLVVYVPYTHYDNNTILTHKTLTTYSFSKNTTTSHNNIVNIHVYIFPSENGHTTETCSAYWIKYWKQCCVRRKPWTWPSTHNRMQTTNFKILEWWKHFGHLILSATFVRNSLFW
jgi:hypothetical protein